MPELPEAEVARRQLERLLTDRPVLAVRIEDPAVVRATLSTRPSDAVPDAAEATAGWVGALAHRPIRHGKRLGLALGDHGFLLHLGMSGKLSVAEEPPAFARLGLKGPTGTVWLVDRRRFGCVTPCPSAELDARIREGHGPDALDAPFDGPGLQEALRCKLAVKVALMDQARLAGIGNIQAAEALFAARIDPRARCDTLSADAWERLASVLPVQLERTIAEADGDGLVYVNEGGDNPFTVYGREDEPCPVCGTAIVAFGQSGRTTYACPRCQAIDDG